MICPNCGNEIADGVKFCPNCGNPMVTDAPQAEPQPAYQPVQGYEQPAQGYEQPVQGYVQPPQGYVQPPQGYAQPVYNEPPKKKSKALIIVLIIVAVLIALIAGAYFALKKIAQKTIDELDTYSNDLQDLDLGEFEDLDDIDLDSLNSEIESLENIDLSEFDDFADANDDVYSESYSYDYADVSYGDNTVTISPNGNLDGSTVLYGGKDLEGLCDYIDNEVLEDGRYINREFLYDLIAVDVVDDSLYSKFDDIELNLIMDCALANNFHNIDVSVTDVVIDAAKPTDCNYDVVAEGREDTWIINFKDKTVYFNNGGTEYSSDMFDDTYLTYWMIAIEDYYGISPD